LPTQATDMEAISGAFMLVKRSALERVGPLDTGYFLHCEADDSDYFRFALGLDAVSVDCYAARAARAPGGRHALFFRAHRADGAETFCRKFQFAGDGRIAPGPLDRSAQHFKNRRA